MLTLIKAILGVFSFMWCVLLITVPGLFKAFMRLLSVIFTNIILPLLPLIILVLLLCLLFRRPRTYIGRSYYRYEPPRRSLLEEIRLNNDVDIAERKIKDAYEIARNFPNNPYNESRIEKAKAELLAAEIAKSTRGY